MYKLLRIRIIIIRKLIKSSEFFILVKVVNSLRFDLALLKSTLPVSNYYQYNLYHYLVIAISYLFYSNI